jgi:hypothetical protein
MKYLKFTHVDALTRTSVESEPARNGPSFPAVAGLQFVWARESAYPTEIPEFFGTCPDSSATQIDGVMGLFLQSDWEQMRADEMSARPGPIGLPDISPRQIRQALTTAGLRDSVETNVAAGNQNLKDWWEFASVFERSNEQVLAMATALGITDREMDDLWALGATL